MILYPERIICMTEESVETLYLLGEEHRIAGVSSYVERPEEAKGLPIISSFTKANIKKIKSLNPDLILGFSDIQQDIAKHLIADGFNVFISNQRSLHEILSYILILGSIVGASDRALALTKDFELKISRGKSISAQFSHHPKVYIEEWDNPCISGIRWFSELVEICGGIDIFKEKSFGKSAKERFVSKEEIRQGNADLALACWCGKKVNKESLRERTEISDVIELNPAIFLQPGPALFSDGIPILLDIFENFSKMGLR